MLPRLKRDGHNSGGLVGILKTRKGMKVWIPSEQRPELMWIQVLWDGRTEEEDYLMNKYVVIVAAGIYCTLTICPGTVLNTLYIFTYFSQEPYELSTIIVSILQMRQRKIKWIAWSYGSIKWESICMSFENYTVLSYYYCYCCHSSSVRNKGV